MPMTVRMRRSPFFERSLTAGAKGHLVYNNMLLATHFESAESDYHHLKRAVQLWDVGCERQIEISGPDAARLVQMSTPRDISGMQPDQCFYIPTVNRYGHMTNDPVLLQVEPNRYWVSIADSDLILYYHGLAAGLALDVAIHEPDVSPLGIQGPLADTLVERMWGTDAARIKFFRHTRVDVDGKPMILARSGYSLQGGYELYYESNNSSENSNGSALWDRLMAAGADLDIRAGSPVQAERVEGGLLSYLSDITSDMTPFEAGLGHFCHLDKDTGCLALDALRKQSEPSRQVRPITIAGDPVPPMTEFWPVTDTEGAPVGRISSAAFAYSYNENIAIGLINRSHWQPNTELRVQTPEGTRTATVRSGFPGRQTRANK
jgi:dimethylsulfoniopropionate demethylase